MALGSDDLGPYVFAGADMTQFVRQWLARLERPDATSAGLLEHAAADPELASRYFYGAAFMMANVGPQAVSSDASDDVLRLFAVLAAYQDARFPGAEPSVWEGCEVHVRRAFDHANAIGHVEVARRLRQDLIDRGQEPDPPGWYTDIKRRRREEDPAKEAAHEREMASIDQRGIRAANLIDPGGAADFDHQLLGQRPQPE